MPIKSMIICLGLLSLLGCGSPDSKDQQKESETADTVQTNTESEKPDSLQEEAEPDIAYSHRRENKLAVSDTLITRKLSEQDDTTGLEIKTGRLNYSGNEPFVVPTIYVSDQEAFRLIADETFMNETFKSLNGKKITLYGKERTVGNRTLLEVRYYKINEN